MRARTLSILFAPLVVACGARTGLGVPEVEDAGVDARPDADVGHDVEIGIDVEPAPPPCDPSLTLIYAVTSDDELLSFDPRTSAFTLMGTLECGAKIARSMAVDRLGHAYVAFRSGNMQRVSLRTLTCTPTAVPADTNAWGMSFAHDPKLDIDKLYVARSPFDAPDHLLELDLTTFELREIGEFAPPIVEAELTGTGDGRLYGFHKSLGSEDTSISLLDRETARVVSTTPLTGVHHGRGWAFAFFGGDFYLFTAPVAGAVVTRFRPADGSLVEVATWPSPITGVGVSTCAPAG